MKLKAGFAAFAAIYIKASLALAQPATKYRDIFTEKNVSEETTSLIQEFLMSPIISFALFASIALLLAGIYFRAYKLVAVTGLIVVLITTFRLLSSQLFGGYNIFQAKFVIPIFLLTLGTKLVTDYVNKKREDRDFESDDEETVTHKRRYVDAPEKYKSAKLSRFGDADERKNVYDKTFSSGTDSRTSSAPPPKLHRSF